MKLGQLRPTAQFQGFPILHLAIQRREMVTGNVDILEEIPQTSRISPRLHRQFLQLGNHIIVDSKFYAKSPHKEKEGKRMQSLYGSKAMADKESGLKETH